MDHNSTIIFANIFQQAFVLYLLNSTFAELLQKLTRNLKLELQQTTVCRKPCEERNKRKHSWRPEEERQESQWKKSIGIHKPRQHIPKMKNYFNQHHIRAWMTKPFIIWASISFHYCSLHGNFLSTRIIATEKFTV